jgi:hypothetical protein
MSVASNSDIMQLLEYVKVDASRVVCHFKCLESDRTIVSVVPFEPYSGKIVLSLKDILLHPIQSYNRYYHTPIVIYGDEINETIVYKAFEQVYDHFIWNEKEQRFLCAKPK